MQNKTYSIFRCKNTLPKVNVNFSPLIKLNRHSHPVLMLRLETETVSLSALQSIVVSKSHDLFLMYHARKLKMSVLFICRVYRLSV